MAIPFLADTDHNRNQARNLRLHNITGSGDFSGLADGVIGYVSTLSDKRIAFWDIQAAALIKVPRLDRSETVSQQWTFAPGSAQAPFVLGSNAFDQLVSRLNADLIDGAHADNAASASTVVLRDAGGRAKVATPVADDDATPKLWVLENVAGLLGPKTAARVLATGNVNVASAPATNAAVWDGLTLVNGDRVGLVFQTTGSENGLYTYNGSGVAMTRTTDADTSAEMPTGTNFLVQKGGTLWGGTRWQLTTPGPITLGTTSLTFVQIGDSSNTTAGPGLGLNGNEIYLKQGTGGSPAGYAYTAGRLVFNSGTNTVDGTNGLHWDSANSRLGINTTSPSEKLHLAAGAMRISQSGAGADLIQLYDNTPTAQFALRLTSGNLVAFSNVAGAAASTLTSGGTFTVPGTLTSTNALGVKVDNATEARVEHHISAVRKGFTSAFSSTTFGLELDSAVTGSILLRAGGAIRFSVTSTGVVNVPGLTASQFVQTNGSKDLVSFDLFGTANTFTASQTFHPATLVPSIQNTQASSYSLLHTLSIAHSSTDAPRVGYNFRATTTSGNYTANTTDVVTMLTFASNGFTFRNAPSTTAGSVATFTDRFLISSVGLVTIPALTASRFVKTGASSELVTVSSIALGTEVSGTLPIANGGTGQTTANAALNALLPSQATHSGKILGTNGTDSSWVTAVQSVGLSLPAGVFTVSGSPVTTTGTLTAVFANQTANTVFAGPGSGIPAAPAFRALVDTDIPVLDAGKITTGVFGVARLGTGSADSSVFLRGDGTWSRTLAGSLQISNSNGLPAASSGTSFYLAAGYANPISGKIIIGDGSGLKFHIASRAASSDTNYFTFTDAGRLGISATTPTHPLHVAGTIYQEGTGNNLLVDGNALFANTLGTKTKILSSGIVSILATADTETLNVGGKVTLQTSAPNVYVSHTSFGAWRGSVINTLPSMFGRIVNLNTQFESGAIAPYTLYDNGTDTKLTLSVLGSQTLAPNSTGYVMRLSYNSAAGGTISPGWGGFAIGTTHNDGLITGAQYRKGSRYVFRIWANIPAGRSLNWASDNIGDDSAQAWITSTAGAGGWREYAMVLTIGSTFSTGAASTGYFYLTGGADSTFTWDVAHVLMIGLDESPTVNHSAQLNIGYSATYGPGAEFGSCGISNNLRVAGAVSIGTTSAAGFKLNVSGTVNLGATTATNVTISSLTPNQLVQSDGTGLLVSTSSLPGGITIGGVAIARKYATTITGNGTNTAFTVTHSLATRDIAVEVWDDTSGDKVSVEIEHTAGNLTNAVTLTFGASVTNGKVYRVVVIG